MHDDDADDDDADYDHCCNKRLGPISLNVFFLFFQRFLFKKAASVKLTVI